MKLEGKFDRPGRNDSLLAQSGVGGKGGKWRHSLFIGSLGLLSLCVTYSSHPQGWVSWKTIFPCPLQCSCLENPRDGGAWWAVVYGVAQSRTRLKWLSSSNLSRWGRGVVWICMCWCWGWFQDDSSTLYLLCALFLLLLHCDGWWNNYTAHHSAESVGALSLFSWAQVVTWAMGSSCKHRGSAACSSAIHFLLCVLVCGRGLWTPDLQDNPGVSVKSKASQNSHFKNMVYLTEGNSELRTGSTVETTSAILSFTAASACICCRTFLSLKFVSDSHPSRQSFTCLISF